jgi:hypothetical protein
LIVSVQSFDGDNVSVDNVQNQKAFDRVQRHVFVIRTPCFFIRSLPRSPVLREFDEVAVGVADVSCPLPPEPIRRRHDGQSTARNQLAKGRIYISHLKPISNPGAVEVGASRGMPSVFAMALLA